MRKATTFAILLIAVLAVGACNKNPAKNDASSARDAAERAIEAASAAGAEQYASEELTKSQDLFAQAEEAYTAGDYDEAARLFREAREWADKARQVALERQRELGIMAAADQPTETAPMTCSLTTDVAGAVVYFDFDKSNIRSDQRGNLEDVAACLKQHPGTQVVIEGHCDERGTNEYNMALGDRRANSAKRFLELQGVSGLTTISYGEEKPAAMGHNEAAWAKNRRVEFRIQ